MEEEIKRYTEELFNEIFGSGQGTLDEFDWEDITQTIEETAHHFVNWQKERQSHWKPSEEQMKALYSALNDAISLYSDKVSPLYEEISRKHFDNLESLYNDLKKLM